MTFRTLYHLFCDHCGNPYPAAGICPSPGDGAIYSWAALRSEAIYSWAALRSEAKSHGWTRRKMPNGVMLDLCPRCDKGHLKAMAGRKDGK